VTEAGNRLVHGPLEHVVDRVALDADVQHVAPIAAASAHLAGHEDVGEEDHLDLDVTRALAGVAAATWEVEREGGRGIPARPRQGRRSCPSTIPGACPYI